MRDFVRGDCHKCKYETSAECVPRSQKMGFPNCYQSTVTNYDLLIRKTPEELAEWVADHPLVSEYDENNPKHKAWLEWLKEEAKDGI